MKYAIITVNHKVIPEDNICEVRKILIKYAKVSINKNKASQYYGFRIYKGVTVIAKDPYFTDNKEHSMKYEFIKGSDTYKATRPSFGNSIFDKSYYSIPNEARSKNTYASIIGNNAQFYLPNEFKCDSDEDAILRFEVEK